VFPQIVPNSSAFCLISFRKRYFMQQQPMGRPQKKAFTQCAFCFFFFPFFVSPFFLGSQYVLIMFPRCLGTAGHLGSVIFYFLFQKLFSFFQQKMGKMGNFFSANSTNFAIFFFFPQSLAKKFPRIFTLKKSRKFKKN